MTSPSVSGPSFDAFARAGAGVEALCPTNGEASTLCGAPGDLASARGVELAATSEVLCVIRAILHDHPDGDLSEMPAAMPVAEVVAAANSCGADGPLVFDSAGVTGHCDHVAATAAGALGAGMVNLPVLGWTLPEPVAAQLNHELGASFIGHQDKDIDLQVRVDRVRQRLASQTHVSQALPSSVLWRRLELFTDTESFRWLASIPRR
jgi:LmbE family N-acetylglucosaminyl deacetylase